MFPYGHTSTDVGKCFMSLFFLTKYDLMTQFFPSRTNLLKLHNFSATQMSYLEYVYSQPFYIY